MTRTRQTARRSSGGQAPRIQLATRARRLGFSYPSESEDNDNQELLVSIFNATDIRTLAVDGEDSLEVIPDEVKLSFKIVEESRDLQEAIVLVLNKLAEARGKIIELGIPNESILTDSLGIEERIVKYLDGTVVSKGYDSCNDSDDDEDDKKGNKNKSRFEKVTFYDATIIMRIQLKCDTVNRFGKIMLAMFEKGVFSHSAPIYETSELTTLRHEARQNAVNNAFEKATELLKGLDNDEICLGLPITINDIPQDISDDSHSSFSHSWFSAMTTYRKTEDNHLEPSTKKIKIDNFMLENLFVMPNITVNACVRAIFEIISCKKE